MTMDEARTIALAEYDILLGMLPVLTPAQYRQLEVTLKAYATMGATIVATSRPRETP